MVQISVEEGRRSERLGRYIRRLREGYGYTLRRVEERSGEIGAPIDNSQLSRFEKGKAAPSFDKLRALARVFNVPVQTFADVLDLDEYDGFKPAEEDPEQLYQMGLEAYRQGDYSRSYVIFERLVEIADAAAGAAAAENHARATYHLAVALKKMGRLAVAETEFRRLLRQNEGTYPISLRVRALLQMAFVYRELGDLYLAGVIARECQARALEAADHETVAAALNTAGIIEEEQGHAEAAARHFQAALAALREESRNGDPDLMRVTVQANLGGALAASNRFRAGVALLRECLRRSRSAGWRRCTAVVLTKMAEAHGRRGLEEQALSLIRESDAVASGGDSPYNDILFMNAYIAWRMARQQGRPTQTRILFGRLKALRSTLETRFAEVDAFDAIVRGEKRHA